MYLAVAGLGAMNWSGSDIEKMLSWVDKKNNSPTTYNKYCLLELNNRDWALYQKNKNLTGCNPIIVYDPYNIGKKIINCMKPDSNFVRNFGGRSNK